MMSMTMRSSSSWMVGAAAVFACLLVGAPNSAQAYYLPESNIQSYEDGQQVKLKVNRLTSVKTLIPLDYYGLPFSTPDGGPKRDNENLGEFLAGDRIESSPYKLYMRTEMYCEQLCIRNIGHAEIQGLTPSKTIKAIRKDYHHNWIVDNLPAASRVEDDESVTTRYWQGFPVGLVGKDGKSYIHNHVNIEIGYRHVAEQPGMYRVVAFTVEPFSIRHETDAATEDELTDDEEYFKLDRKVKIRNPIASCIPKKSPTNEDHTNYDMIMEEGRIPQVASGDVLFTYDVIWTLRDDIEFGSRWDIYLSLDGAVPPKVHWLSIANSMVIVFVLSAMIAAILVRNLHRDIARYNKVAIDEESRAEELEEYGWKLVHADVFRPPSFSPMLLAVATGTGAQLTLMALITIFFSALGFMSPARRGHLLMAQILLFVFLGGINGYITARFYKTFKGKSWQKATMATAFGFPGIAFAIFIAMNIVALMNESTDAVPFFTMFVLVILWFGISTPLVFVGAWFGYKQEAIEFPVNTSSIPRQIPDQPWFMGIPFTLLIGGILPFGSCFVELYYIMSSVWMEYYYYVFGFLLLVFLILLITCAEITILFTYFQLCSEDYHWWWRSFCNAGSTAIYVFLYSFVYFKQLEANSPATYFLYFGYMGLVSLGLFTMMGFVGMSASLWFSKTIFSSIKID